MTKAPRFVLKGVSVDHELSSLSGLEVGEHFAAVDRVLALAHGWKGAFSNVFCDQDAMNVFLLKYKHRIKWDWSPSTCPSHESFKHILSHAKNTCPGWDGIPYSVWEACGNIGSTLLNSLHDSLCSNEPTHSGLKDSIWQFPAKKPIPSDPVGEYAVVRAPKDTRPIACNVVENKIVGAVTVHSVDPTLQACGSSKQRGFVRGRQLGQNVIELDAIA